LARAKATLQRRPLAEVCRELGSQTFVENSLGGNRLGEFFLGGSKSEERPNQQVE